MSAVSVTFRRTIGLARNTVSTALSVAAFLSAASVLLAFNLEAAEGHPASVVSLWALSIAPFLPALAAFLAMDVWSDERRTGRIELLLSLAVPERDLVMGKLVGVWVMALGAVLLHFVATAVTLAFVGPSALSGASLSSFLPAFGILALQALLWSSLSVALSAMFTHASAALCTSLALMVALPRGLWKALLCWAPQGRSAFGILPLDAHVLDVATGVVSPAVLFAYALFAAFGAFWATRRIVALRYPGRSGRKGRGSAFVATVLALVSSVALTALAFRFDHPLDIPVGRDAEFSPRLRRLLSESSGTLTVTCFMSRHDASFRSTGRFLRALARESEAVGGVQMTVRYVDPKWDFGAAGRLVRQGAREGSVVFEKGRRFATLPVDRDFGERGVVSTLQSVALPPQRRDICWVTGHGESAFDAYDAWGMSDIARELLREGYRNRAVDLTREGAIPSDCALLVVAGAKNDFSRAELARVDAYLKSGGRLLVLIGQPGQGGVASLLPAWGIRPFVPTAVGSATLSGTDVIVSEFSDHTVSSALAGSRIVLEKPLAFASSAVAESGTGADRIEFSALARSGAVAVAAVAERGAGAGSDLAIRPTRIVAIGDASFALNGALSARANANRDFFLNAVSYLSGTDVVGASGLETDVFSTGMDRAQRARFLMIFALAVPAGVFVVMFLIALRRRMRS